MARSSASRSEVRRRREMAVGILSQLRDQGRPISTYVDRLAADLGVTLRTVWRWLGGAAKPPVTVGRLEHRGPRVSRGQRQRTPPRPSHRRPERGHAPSRLRPSADSWSAGGMKGGEPARRVYDTFLT